MSLKILVVGAGGLGCELLKLLAQSRMYRITIVDDDTIDATNLNRQFLFTRADVGQSKAACAAKKLVRRYTNDDKDTGLVNGPEIVALHVRIQKYPKIEFYKRFDIVFNCLDNNEARSFVNQRCHLAGVPMIDGGSAGWLGQSFHNGRECFDCLPSKMEAAIPLCTIRQNPTEFKHCLVWALSVVENKDVDVIYEDLLGILPNEANVPTNYYSVACTENEHARMEMEQSSNATGAAAGLKSKAKDFKSVPYVPSIIRSVLPRNNLHKNNENIKNIKPALTNSSPSQCKRKKINTISSKIYSASQHSHINEQHSGPASSNVFIEPECSSALLSAISAESGHPDARPKVLAPVPGYSDTPSLSSSSDSDALYLSNHTIDIYVKKLENVDSRSRSFLVYDLAVLKAQKHRIERMTYTDSQQIINNIIPSVCTTNSVIAALMILSARNRRNYYLVQSDSRFVPMDLNPSHIRCLTCSVPVYLCKFSSHVLMRDVLFRFKASSAITEAAFYDAFSTASIDELDGHFAILYRDELPFRFYFEKTENGDGIKEPVVSITRIK